MCFVLFVSPTPTTLNRNKSHLCAALMLLLCVPCSICIHTAKTIHFVLLYCYTTAVNSYLDGNAQVFDYQSILFLMQ